MIKLNEVAATVQFPAGQGISITTIGSDHLFASLHVRRLGELIELVNELTLWQHKGCGYGTEELGREVTDEDDAVNIAIDMQRAAYRRLDELGVSDYDIIAVPDSFGEALEAHFDKARAHHAVAAE
jgi:hypothetical protein